MSLFSKPKAVLWPKSESTDLYLDRTENNIFSVDINLWKPCTSVDIQSLILLLNQHKTDTCTILIPDDVVVTKSFIYDSEISSIEKKEVIGLAESTVRFKINPDFIDFRLVPSAGKTIILAHIFDKTKIEALKANLSLLKLKSFSFESVSQAISKVISLRFNGEYFLIYPLSKNEYTLSLSQKDSVYLTANLKGPDLDVQKIINYSNLYFPAPTTKFYLPTEEELEINSTNTLEKTPYSSSQIAQEFKKAANLPLPVIGLMIPSNTNPVIINSSMEKNHNLLPFIGVFLVTALIASGIIWFVLSKNNNSATNVENPLVNNITPTIITEAPTATPIPTIIEINKKIKIQVLNATDINGQAAVLKEKLTKLGFTSVAVGNSKESATANSIQIKASLSSGSAYFKQNLSDFSAVTPLTNLKETSTYDVVFIIGTKLETNSSPTETP